MQNVTTSPSQNVVARFGRRLPLTTAPPPLSLLSQVTPDPAAQQATRQKVTRHTPCRVGRNSTVFRLARPDAGGRLVRCGGQDC